MKIIALLAALAWSLAAFGQNAPSGQQVLNQGLNGVAVSNSDTTVLRPTRALFIGNATACNIAVVFSQAGSGGSSTAAVTLQNVQTGQIIPLSVTKVMSTNNTCSNTIALY